MESVPAVPYRLALTDEPRRLERPPNSVRGIERLERFELWAASRGLRVQMKDDHFEFTHLFDRVARAFFSKARIFETSVGHQIDPPLRAPIDVEVARFRLPGKLHCPFDILGKNAGRQSINTVISQSDRFFNRIKRRYPDCKAE